MSHARARSPQTQIERIVVLEAHREAIDKRVGNIESMVKEMYDAFTQAKGIRFLLIAIGSFVGITAATVTATVAAIRFFTGH